MTTETKFGIHNPTLTTKYASKFMARGYEVEDMSYQHDLTDSLILTHLQHWDDSYHIHIPNAEVTNSDEEEFSHFVLSPYDTDLCQEDTDNSQVIPTFDGVMCYLENPISTTQYEEDGDMVVGVKCKAPFTVDGEGDPIYDKETDEYVLYFTVE